MRVPYDLERVLIGARCVWCGYLARRAPSGHFVRASRVAQPATCVWCTQRFATLEGV